MKTIIIKLRKDISDIRTGKLVRDNFIVPEGYILELIKELKARIEG